MGRRGAAVGFLHREEKCEKGAGIAPLLWPGGVKDLGSFFLSIFFKKILFFSVFPFPPALAARRWVGGHKKMGTPTTSICGLILSLILTCQLVTVSQTFSLQKLSTVDFFF